MNMKMERRTKEVLEKSIGISISELKKMDLEDEIIYLERKLGKKVCFSRTPNSRIQGRGNPLLAKRRFTTINEVDDKIKRIT